MLKVKVFCESSLPVQTEVRVHWWRTCRHSNRRGSGHCELSRDLQHGKHTRTFFFPLESEVSVGLEWNKWQVQIQDHIKTHVIEASKSRPTVWLLSRCLIGEEAIKGMVAVQATSLKLFLFVSRQRAESVRLWWTHQARVKPYWAETPIKPLYWGRSTGKESDPCRSPLESHEAFQDSNDSKRFKASQDILFVSLYSRLTWSRIPFRSSEPREMPFVTLCSGIASLYSKGTKGVRLVRLVRLFESFKDRAMKMPRLGEYPVPRLQQKMSRKAMDLSMGRGMNGDYAGDMHASQLNGLRSWFLICLAGICNFCMHESCPWSALSWN